MQRISLGVFLLALLVTSACKPRSTEVPSPNRPDAETAPQEVDAASDAVPPESIDHGFAPLAALPAVPPTPADNPTTPAKVELGRYLFFDDRLSGDVGTSCASCHDPRLGFGDGNALSRGYAGTQHWRNSQTTVNSAYLAKLFWAGESPSLEAQAHSAITGNLAGNGEPAMIEERLVQIPEYVRLFEQAFGVPQPTYAHALNAIAAFERSEMISSDSDFDAYMNGDHEALDEDDLLGMRLFVGKAKCITCHNGPLMTDQDFHNLGIPRHPLFEQDPLRQISLRYQHYIRGVPESVYRSADRDLGLYYTTKRDEDMGKFRTPPLRYLAYTAPYMHNGVFASLEEVVDFYNQGGGEDENKSPLLQPLGLTEDEKFALVAFLESLSGSVIRMTPPESLPYEVIVTEE